MSEAEGWKLLDENRKAIPQANLEALKAFIAARRNDRHGGPEVVQEQLARLPKELQGLPEKTKLKLIDFLAHLKDIRFLRPDGHPNPEWMMFYGPTWDKAKEAAWVFANSKSSEREEFDTNHYDKSKKSLAAAEAMFEAAQGVDRSDAFNAAEDLADEIARDCAWAAASGSALEPIKRIGRCAQRVAGMIVVEDLNFKGKGEHLDFIRRMWQVWEKGYGFEIEDGSELLVYSKTATPA